MCVCVECSWTIGCVRRTEEKIQAAAAPTSKTTTINNTVRKHSNHCEAAMLVTKINFIFVYFSTCILLSFSFWMWIVNQSVYHAIIIIVHIIMLHYIFRIQLKIPCCFFFFSRETYRVYINITFYCVRCHMTNIKLVYHLNLRSFFFVSVLLHYNFIFHQQQ